MSVIISQICIYTCIFIIVFQVFFFSCIHFSRLTHGLDYKGNLCGDKHANPDLSGLQVRYWVNPNQVYQSGLKESQFKLVDARSICLKNCPVASEDSLKWVCDYPEGDIHLSVKEWVHRNYDYFDFLTPEMRNASLQLQGPCYPVIFPSVNGKLFGVGVNFSTLITLTEIKVLLHGLKLPP